VGYVPDGMSPEQYRKMKEQEKNSIKGKNLGTYGPQTFKSRSMLSFQKDLEAGKAKHLMPVFNAQEKLKKGIIKKEDIPYMQRMGAWDNSDLGKKNGKQWRPEDKQYNQNQKENTFDWSGKQNKFGPGGINRKPQPAQEAPKKKLFGMF
jgi:hypothetical protein